MTQILADDDEGENVELILVKSQILSKAKSLTLVSLTLIITTLYSSIAQFGRAGGC